VLSLRFFGIFIFTSHFQQHPQPEKKKVLSLRFFGIFFLAGGSGEAKKLCCRFAFLVYFLPHPSWHFFFIALRALGRQKKGPSLVSIYFYTLTAIF
jgi:hypothetical protein